MRLAGEFHIYEYKTPQTAAHWVKTMKANGDWRQLDRFTLAWTARSEVHEQRAAHRADRRAEGGGRQAGLIASANQPGRLRPCGRAFARLGEVSCHRRGRQYLDPPVQFTAAPTITGA